MFYRVWYGSVNRAVSAGIEEFDSYNDAIEYAYNLACEDYDSYAGFHGVRSTDDIMEEEGCDYNEANDIYHDERENNIDYWVEECEEGDDPE